MEVHSEFESSAAPDDVWNLLLDVERVAPCMPGAELTETIDDTNWKGRVRMRLGPVTMKYAGRVTMIERDDATRTVRLRGEGTEESGKGNAAAVVTSQVVATESGGSRVLITQDLELSGKAAQFGGRMIQDVAALLTKQFAQSLNQVLSETVPASSGSPVPASAGTTASTDATSTAEPRAVAATLATAQAAADAAPPAAAAPRAAAAPARRAPAPQRSNEVSAFKIASYALLRAIARRLHLPWGRR